MKMIKEDFLSINEIEKDFETFLKVKVEEIVERWRVKEIPFKASITDVIGTTVVISCLFGEYLIDFDLCYLLDFVNEEQKIPRPLILIKFYKFPKNKYFEEEGIIQIGENYYIREKFYIGKPFMLLDKNQEVIISYKDIPELLIDIFFDAIAKNIPVLE